MHKFVVLPQEANLARHLTWFDTNARKLEVSVCVEVVSGGVMRRGEAAELIKDRLCESIRATIDAVIEEAPDAFLGRCRYDRVTGKPTGYRNGCRERQLIGSFEPETISVPRARAINKDGKTT